MNEPLLSICIPTYNRAIFLKRLCESIFSQTDEDTLKRLEVCISDNASTDNTGVIVNEFSSQYPGNITYKINDKNYGAVYNLFQVLRTAKGKYLLCIGDDDIFIDGAVSYLTKLIEKIKNDEEIKLILTKFDSRHGNKTVFRGFDSLESDKIYYQKDIEDFFVKDKFWCNGFAGAQVFHRNLIKDYFNNLATQDNHNQWPHLRILLRSLKNLKKIFVTRPVIYQTGDGLFWLRANWILVLFQKIIVLDNALFKKEIKGRLAAKICSSILFSSSMLRLAISAKIEDPGKFLMAVKEVRAYRPNNSNMRLRINIFKLLLNTIDFIPLKVLETMYLFCTKVFRMNDFRVKGNSLAVTLENKREGMSTS